MDYGDGTYQGIFQFNTQYRKKEICTILTRAVNDACPAIVPFTPVCGNSIVEPGETCECAGTRAGNLQYLHLLPTPQVRGLFFYISVQ